MLGFLSTCKAGINILVTVFSWDFPVAGVLNETVKSFLTVL